MDNGTQTEAADPRGLPQPGDLVVADLEGENLFNERDYVSIMVGTVESVTLKEDPSDHFMEVKEEFCVNMGATETVSRGRGTVRVCQDQLVDSPQLIARYKHYITQKHDLARAKEDLEDAMLKVHQEDLTDPDQPEPETATDQDEDTNWRYAMLGTVQMVVEVGRMRDSDVVSDCLSESMADKMRCSGEGSLVDWQYHQVGALRALPSPTFIPKAGEYETSDFLKFPLKPVDGRHAHVVTLDLCMDAGDTWGREEGMYHFGDLVSGTNCVWDWSFLRVGGQFIPPRMVEIPTEDEYQEGDAFDENKIAIL